MPPAQCIDRRLSVAPMLDWTDKFCRYFHRLLSRKTLLYTEMVTTGALLHNDPKRFLDFFSAEHPLALQLGGSDPDALAQCAALGEEWNYDEINLNVGCPSDRVQSGRFGACLMAEPQLVADCVQAMCEAVELPITVKHRIGIDRLDDYDHLCHFVDRVAQGGCRVFIVHARKAWLNGLSPKQNREIPPLRHEWVHRLKHDFPHLVIVLNGGITTLAQARAHLAHVDGIMIGRAAYQTPWILARADTQIFAQDCDPCQHRLDVFEDLLPFAEHQIRNGVPLKQITRHILGLFHGQPNAKKWRRFLAENAYQKHADVEVLRTSLELLRCDQPACESP